MAVDPTDPETFKDFENSEDSEKSENFENFENFDGNDAGIDVEAAEGDAAEQHADIAPTHDDPLTGVDPDRASEADLIEQARVVSLDEDDYR